MDNWPHNKESSRFSAAKIIDTVQEAIAILNKERQIISVNKAFCRLFDTTKSKIENHSLFELQDISKNGTEVKKLFEKIASNDGKVENYELFQYRPDREKRLLLTIRNINEPGEEKLFLVEVVDVTKKSEADKECQRKFEKICGEMEQKNKKLESQLVYDSNLISAIFSTRGVIIAIIDASGNVVDLNQAFLEITAYSLEEIKGKPFWKFFPQKDFHKIKCQRDNCDITDIPVIIEKWIRSKNAEMHLINWRISVIRNEKGVITHVIATGNDITDHQEAENRTQKLNDDLRKNVSELQIVNNELETFSYSVSHDLKSPLGIISGFSQLIIDQYSLQLDPELVSYLYRIIASTKKMNILINDLLTLSRISRADLIIENISLSEMVSAFLTELQASEPRRRTEFSVQKDIEVQADRRLLHLAIENLLSNAWKYCSKEEITRISFGTVIKNGTVAFFVKDNGVGFDMKYSEKIFKPFQRLHSERDFKGTGIGLATVVRVLRRHNGHIWAEAEIGKGATFYFSIGTNKE